MIYRLGDREPEIVGDGHFVADNASVIGRVRLEDKSSVWFNAVLRGDNELITIGERSNVQDGSVLHTDPGMPLTLGAGVTIGHKVMLHGCTIGDNALIGIGSTILNGAKIGANSVVGAHALVTEGKEFPEGVLILGAPAKVARELSADEIAQIGLSADVYVKNAARFSAELKSLS
ncbi:MAG: gamma carbonic anhydrase family protein [Woeseiaceae bacterium]|nr:gamma carbonic anhydrase family protein [Woeseiaceae bacterium]